MKKDQNLQVIVVATEEETWIPQYLDYKESERISRINPNEFTALSKQVCLRQIHDFVSTAIQHRLDHVKRKALYFR